MPAPRFATIAPKVVGSISMICSCFLIFDILRSKTKRSKVTNRLLVSLSVTDLLYTFFVAFLTTWPVPTDLRDYNGDLVESYGNAGTVGTCRMQGFLDQFAAKSSYLYNAELATAYYLMIQFGWNEEKMRRIEPIFHGVALVTGLVCAIVPLAYNALNATGEFSCWIADTPLGCVDGGVECDGGENFKLLRHVLSDSILLATQAVVFLMMFLLYRGVRAVEKRMENYQFDLASGAGASRNQSRKIAIKALFYVLAFEITWFFNIMRLLWGYFAKGGDRGKGFAYICDIFLFPTFGIWTFLNHFRLRFFKRRTDHPEWNCCQLLRHVIIPPPKEHSSTSQAVNANKS